MRKLTIQELESLAGAGDVPTVTVTGHPPNCTSVSISWPPSTRGGPSTTSAEGTSAQPPVTNQPAECEPVLPDANRIDRSRITSDEGGIRTTGYTIPVSVAPLSGVTISAGVDLGYRTTDELRSLGISQAGINAMSPYIGLTGQAAIDQVRASGLPTISASDATILYNGIYNHILSDITAKFNNASVTGIQFYQLPQEAQTAIMDLAYNTPNLPAKAPTFWRDVTEGNWIAAAWDLDNWKAVPGGYTSDDRHRRLAQDLRNAVAFGQLPYNSKAGTCP